MQYDYIGGYVHFDLDDANRRLRRGRPEKLPSHRKKDRMIWLSPLSGWDVERIHAYRLIEPDISVDSVVLAWPRGRVGESVPSAGGDRHQRALPAC
jgi:hypothetical protein